MHRKALQWIASAMVVAFVAGCANQDSTVKTKEGAVIGGLLGAATGAVIGNQSGRPLEGAAIGGAVGAGTGAVVGSTMDEKDTQAARAAQAQQPVNTGTVKAQPVPATVYVTCPNCGTKNDVTGFASGTKAQCPKCGTVFTVP